MVKYSRMPLSFHAFSVPVPDGIQAVRKDGVIYMNRKFRMLFLLVSVLICICAVCASSAAEGGMKIIAFSDAGPEKETDGVGFDKGVLSIGKPGEYMLSGTLSNGQIHVDCTEEGEITLYLNGISVRNETSSALLIGECQPKLILSLVEQTENVISSGRDARDSDDSDSGCAVFSRSDLVIEGDGTLIITSEAADGIVSRDDLKIRGGKITVSAKRHGLKGKDSVEILGGELDITAGRDGIKSTNKEDEERGYVSVRNAAVSIRCGDEPIQFVTRCDIDNAKISIAMDKD